MRVRHKRTWTGKLLDGTSCNTFVYLLDFFLPLGECFLSHIPATHSLHTINNPFQFVVATIDEIVHAVHDVKLCIPRAYAMRLDDVRGCIGQHLDGEWNSHPRKSIQGKVLHCYVVSLKRTRVIQTHCALQQSSGIACSGLSALDHHAPQLCMRRRMILQV